MMDDKEAMDMMHRCVDELTTNRKTIEYLSVRAEAYEVIRDVVRMASPKSSQGYSEDLVWRLKKKIEELKPKPKIAEVD
jgi:hypothetical protein